MTRGKPRLLELPTDSSTAKLPKPKDEDAAETKVESEVPLPQTLVRIPTQHAPALMPQPGADAE